MIQRNCGWILMIGMIAILGSGCQTPKPEPVAQTEVVAKERVAPPQRPATPAPKPQARPTGRVTSIELDEFFPLQQSGQALIYDVRPAFFYAMGNIPGSQNWPVSGYEKQLEARETEIRAARAKNQTIVIYCTNLACPDARGMAERLAKLGHSSSVLSGGWEAWKDAELPGS